MTDFFDGFISRLGNLVNTGSSLGSVFSFVPDWIKLFLFVSVGVGIVIGLIRLIIDII